MTDPADAVAGNKAALMQSQQDGSTHSNQSNPSKAGVPNLIKPHPQPRPLHLPQLQNRLNSKSPTQTPPPLSRPQFINFSIPHPPQSINITVHNLPFGSASASVSSQTRVGSISSTASSTSSTALSLSSTSPASHSTSTSHTQVQTGTGPAPKPQRNVRVIIPSGTHIATNSLLKGYSLTPKITPISPPTSRQPAFPSRNSLSRNSNSRNSIARSSISRSSISRNSNSRTATQSPLGPASPNSTIVSIASREPITHIGPSECVSNAMAVKIVPLIRHRPDYFHAPDNGADNNKDSPAMSTPTPDSGVAFSPMTGHGHLLHSHSSSTAHHHRSFTPSSSTSTVRTDRSSFIGVSPQSSTRPESSYTTRDRSTKSSVVSRSSGSTTRSSNNRQSMTSKFTPGARITVPDGPSPPVITHRIPPPRPSRDNTTDLHDFSTQNSRPIVQSHLTFSNKSNNQDRKRRSHLEPLIQYQPPSPPPQAVVQQRLPIPSPQLASSFSSSSSSTIHPPSSEIRSRFGLGSFRGMSLSVSPAGRSPVRTSPVPEIKGGVMESTPKTPIDGSIHQQNQEKPSFQHNTAALSSSRTNGGRTLLPAFGFLKRKDPKKNGLASINTTDLIKDISPVIDPISPVSQHFDTPRPRKESLQYSRNPVPTTSTPASTTSHTVAAHTNTWMIRRKGTPDVAPSKTPSTSSPSQVKRRGPAAGTGHEAYRFIRHWKRTSTGSSIMHENQSQSDSEAVTGLYEIPVKQRGASASVVSLADALPLIGVSLGPVDRGITSRSVSANGTRTDDRTKILPSWIGDTNRSSVIKVASSPDSGSASRPQIGKSSPSTGGTTSITGSRLSFPGQKMVSVRNQMSPNISKSTPDTVPSLVSTGTGNTPFKARTGTGTMTSILNGELVLPDMYEPGPSPRDISQHFIRGTEVNSNTTEGGNATIRTVPTKLNFSQRALATLTPIAVAAGERNPISTPIGNGESHHQAGDVRPPSSLSTPPLPLSRRPLQPSVWTLPHYALDEAQGLASGIDLDDLEAIMREANESGMASPTRKSMEFPSSSSSSQPNPCQDQSLAGRLHDQKLELDGRRGRNNTGLPLEMMPWLDGVRSLDRSCLEEVIANVEIPVFGNMRNSTRSSKLGGCVCLPQTQHMPDFSSCDQSTALPKGSVDNDNVHHSGQFDNAGSRTVSGTSIASPPPPSSPVFVDDAYWGEYESLLNEMLDPEEGDGNDCDSRTSELDGTTEDGERNLTPVGRVNGTTNRHFRDREVSYTLPGLSSAISLDGNVQRVEKVGNVEYGLLTPESLFETVEPVKPDSVYYKHDRGDAPTPIPTPTPTIVVAKAEISQVEKGVYPEVVIIKKEPKKVTFTNDVQTRHFDSPRVSSSSPSADSIGKGSANTIISKPFAGPNLRFAALLISRYLTFGRVLFSPVHSEASDSRANVSGELNSDDSVNKAPTDGCRILVIDGLGRDFSFYLALTYPNAQIFTLSPSPIPSGMSGSRSVSASSSTPALPPPPPNHQFIHHPNLSSNLAFPANHFSAVIVRFLPLMPTQLLHSLLSECKRVLYPGGYLEYIAIDADLVNMGEKGRAKVRKVKMTVCESVNGVDMRPLDDGVVKGLGSAGMEGIRICCVGVPVVPGGSGVDGGIDREDRSMPRTTKLDEGVPMPEELETVAGTVPAATNGTPVVARSPMARPAGIHYPLPQEDQRVSEMAGRVGRWWYWNSYERIGEVSIPRATATATATAKAQSDRQGSGGAQMWRAEGDVWVINRDGCGSEKEAMVTQDGEKTRFFDDPEFLQECREIGTAMRVVVCVSMKSRVGGVRPWSC